MGERIARRTWEERARARQGNGPGLGAPVER